jgi:hypothetical protein
MKNTTFFHTFKQWLAKSVVSATIFVSIVLLGGIIITAAMVTDGRGQVNSLATSQLSNLYSFENGNKLTSGNWNSLVYYVKSLGFDVASLSGTVNQLSAQIINVIGNGGIKI